MLCRFTYAAIVVLVSLTALPGQDPATKPIPLDPRDIPVKSDEDFKEKADDLKAKYLDKTVRFSGIIERHGDRLTQAVRFHVTIGKAKRGKQVYEQDISANIKGLSDDRTFALLSKGPIAITAIGRVKEIRKADMVVDVTKIESLKNAKR